MAVQYQLTHVSWPGSFAAGTVTCTVTTPDGSTFTLQGSSGSQQTPNAWSAWFTPQEIGAHTLAWAASSGSTYTTTLNVVEAPARPSAIDLNDCYDSLKLNRALQGKDADKDEDMLAYAAAATAVAEGIIGPIAPQTVTEIFNGGAPSVLLAWKPTAILQVIENGSPATGWVPDFRAGILHAGYFGASFTAGTRNLRVTYTVGSGRVEANVILGVREIFRQVWERSRAMGGAASTDTVLTGFAVPNAVYELFAANAQDLLPGFA